MKQTTQQTNNIMRLSLLLTILLIFLTGVQTEAQNSTDMVGLDYLYVGAHPDDEGGFTGTMIRYNHDEGYRGSVAVFTLGQGGGNALGPEVEGSLGLLRYEELRRSLSIAGVDRFYYLGFPDFYFTQSADLTRKVWSEHNPEFLCELVRVIRLTKPEVIVSMWPGPGTHGHHQMATRSAIEAFNISGDPNACSFLITDEYLDVWEPMKLYISAPQGRNSISVPLSDFSATHNMRYADIRSFALRNFRTQGWDRGNTIPASRTGDESRMLVKSRVPVGNPETHYMEGTHIPAGTSPVGVRMVVDTDSYRVTSTDSFEVTVELGNNSAHDFENVAINLVIPDGWTSENASQEIGNMSIGDHRTIIFKLSPTSSLTMNEQQEVWVNYTADIDGNGIKGENYTWVEPVSPLSVKVNPLFDIIQYREFATQTDTEFLTPNLPTRVPLSTGLENEITLILANSGNQTEQGRLEFNLPTGISVQGDLNFNIAGGESIEKSVSIVVTEDAFLDERQSFADIGTVSAVSNNFRDTDTMEFYVLPYLDIEKTDEKISIDADLSQLSNYTSGTIGHTDRWSGNISGPDDSSADFHLAYDDQYLYLGIEVNDNIVTCHMPSNRIRNHWYGDAIEITIDPSGNSSDVSTTFRASIFPCSTEGFQPNAARYGDANYGPISSTAPDMKVASIQTENGYILEMAIPWISMEKQPVAGDQIRFNALIYDADEENPEEGADYGKSRIGWGSSIGAQQATTYTWPVVTLKP